MDYKSLSKDFKRGIGRRDAGHHQQFAVLAQLEELLICNESVEGSIPSGSANSINPPLPQWRGYNS